MARVYAVASSKGGVGKTTTTANLSATLAAAGYDVAVVDGDIGMANLGNQLGVDADGATLHDVLAGEATVEDATYEGSHGLAVVPGDTALAAFGSADVTKLGTVLGSFADRDFVFVDTGAGLSHETALPVGLADEVILVSTADRDALGDTEKTRELAERLGVPVAGVVLNRVTETPEDAGPLGAEILGSVPEDATLRGASDAGTPITRYDLDAPAAAAYRGIASSLADGPVRPPVAEESEDGDAPEAEPTAESDVSHPEPEPVEEGVGDAAPDEAPAADDDGGDVEAVDVESESADGDDDEGISIDEGDAETEAAAESGADAEIEADAETGADAETEADETDGVQVEAPADEAADAEPEPIPDAEGDGTGDAEEDAIPFADGSRDTPMVEQDDDGDDDDGKQGFLSRLFG